MTEAQIKNVIEKNNYVYIEPEKGSMPSPIQMQDAYLAGWNSQILVIVHNASKNGGNPYIYDSRGNSTQGTLRLHNMNGAKITVSSNAIVVTNGSTTYYYDFKGQPKK